MLPENANNFSKLNVLFLTKDIQGKINMNVSKLS